MSPFPRMSDSLSSSWRLLAAVFLGATALLTLGCADDRFLPPPDGAPYGQTQPDEAQPLEPPADL